MPVAVRMPMAMRVPVTPRVPIVPAGMPMAASVPMHLRGLLDRALLHRRRGARIDERQRLRAFGRCRQRQDSTDRRDAQQLRHSHELLLGSAEITSGTERSFIN